MRDHFHPPFSDCVRVTTRGQKPALILCSLKRPGREDVKLRPLSFEVSALLSTQSFSQRYLTDYSFYALIELRKLTPNQKVDINVNIST